MKPRVVDGLDGQSDEAYWKVYTSLFRASLVAETAARHINTWKFLATLRNTIHNNGTFYPNDHKDATFSIGGYEYAFRDGQSVEAFGLDNVAVYLQEIRLGFADLLSSPRVSSIPAIHDFAYTPLSGTPSRGDGTA